MDLRQAIAASDAGAVWRSLHQLAASHHLARLLAAKDSQFTFDGRHYPFCELTQDLFLILLEKGRFEAYIAEGLTSAEISRQISRIEIQNLITEQLRVRKPESYRIARRIAQILQSDSRFSQNVADGPSRTKIFHLTHWGPDRPRFEMPELKRRAASVPCRPRANQFKGVSGDSQLIISNPDLANLLVEIFIATNSPASLRDMRNLAMSKLTIMDMPEPEGLFTEDDEPIDLPADQFTAEENAIRADMRHKCPLLVDRFLLAISAAARSRTRYLRYLNILHHSYFAERTLTLNEIAELLGIGTSTVSGFRRRIDVELGYLGIEDLEIAERFAQLLAVRVARELRAAGH